MNPYEVAYHYRRGYVAGELRGLFLGLLLGIFLASPLIAGFWWLVK